MQTLDRYFIKQLFYPICFCSATLIFLMHVADIFDHLDLMIKYKTPILRVLQYYAALTPEAFVATISWASLLGTIYVLTHFNYHNELTALKVAGLEITSITRPVIFVGFIVSVATFFVDDQIVPKSSQTAQDLLEGYIEKKNEEEPAAAKKTYHDVTYYGGRNRLYYVRSFDPKAETLEDFTILWLDQERRVKKKTVAKKATWTGTVWGLHQTSDYVMERSGETLGEPKFEMLTVYPEIRETPQEFLKAATEDTYTSYRDLKDYVEKLKTNGIKLDTEAVTLNYKLAAPWQSLAVMFLAIPVLAKTSTRRMIALNVLVCLGCVFLFHISSAVTLALGKAGKLLPLLSAWSPNFIFGFGTFFFLDRANH